MGWLVYFLTIFSLLGSSYCGSNRAFRALNKKVNLLKTSFQRDVDDLKASFQQEVDDLKFEVLDLKTKLYLEKERTERLEEILNGTGAFTGIGVSTKETYVETTQRVDTKTSRCREAIRAGGKRMAELLYVGVRVKRGKNWKWGFQDGKGPGIVTLVYIDNLDNAWVKVAWDEGLKNNYRMGVENAYDLMIVEEEFDFSRC